MDMSEAIVATARVSRFGSMRSYPAGTLMYGQDDSVGDVYLIHSGVIKLIWMDRDGRETIIGLRWPGWFLGAASLIATLPSPASAITLVASTVEKIAAGDFLQLLSADPNLTMRLHQAHSREILEQMHELGELACRPARARLESLLQRLAGSVSDSVRLPNGRLRLPLKKKELAALLSVTPEHLSRTLDELAREGTIVTNGQWIVLRDVCRGGL
jgi:CRP-like cAMP-binding protein